MKPKFIVQTNVWSQCHQCWSWMHSKILTVHLFDCSTSVSHTHTHVAVSRLEHVYKLHHFARLSINTSLAVVTRGSIPGPFLFPLYSKSLCWKWQAYKLTTCLIAMRCKLIGQLFSCWLFAPKYMQVLGFMWLTTLSQRLLLTLSDSDYQEMFRGLLQLV